ncbi:hypothetical protein F4818DRAFT_453590 [Hypoxylon cercidicola]|nr:hypothetical protein F4818DRAFT_453590 [Hypoxylon cercidicola]
MRLQIKHASLGAPTLILGVRSIEKGETAKQAIISKTICSPDIFLIETVDLSTFASVKFCDLVKQRVKKLAGGHRDAGIRNGARVVRERNAGQRALDGADGAFDSAKAARDGCPSRENRQCVSAQSTRGASGQKRGPGVIVNACCPGLCKTNMRRDFSFMNKMAMSVTYIKQGAMALGAESYGKFWANDELMP